MRNWRALLSLQAVLTIVLLACTCAGARAEVRCIEASRYDKLARITSGNMKRLVTGLGLPANDVPPPDACRAVLMTGTINAGAVDDLMRAIASNRGWLAVVYLAIGDGDLLAEVKLAQAMRMFRLAGFTMVTDVDYTADFLPPVPDFPMSVSYGWPEKESEVKTPLIERLDDYYAGTARRIERGTSRCQRGCGTILAGAVDRVEIAVGNAEDSRGAVARQSPAAEAARDSVRARLGLPGRSVHLPVGWWAGGRMIRLPDDVEEAAKNECHARIDFAASLSSGIAADIDGYARKSFPFMKLGDLARKSRDLGKAGAAVDLCVIQVLDRQRKAAFAKHCTDRCDTRALDAAATAMLGSVSHR